MTLITGHALLMSTVFLLFLCALLIAATQREKRWWLRAHRGVGISGASVMVLGAVIAFAAVATAPNGGHHLRTPHTWLGALAVSTAVIVPIIGLLQTRIHTKAGTLRLVHRISGRALTVMAALAILLGLRAAEIL
jgi:hypothetical protein